MKLLDGRRNIERKKIMRIGERSKGKAEQVALVRSRTVDQRQSEHAKGMLRRRDQLVGSVDFRTCVQQVDAVDLLRDTESV